MRSASTVTSLVALVLLACATKAPSRSGMVGRELPVGALVDSQALPVGTGTLAADGPAVLVFYRGHW